MILLIRRKLNKKQKIRLKIDFQNSSAVHSTYSPCLQVKSLLQILRMKLIQNTKVLR